MYVEDDIVVINATSGIGDPKDPTAGFDCFPSRNDTGKIYEGSIEVEKLGPEAAELLAAHGREGQKKIGFPLTMHFGSSGGISLRSSLRCRLVDKDDNDIEGVLVFDDGEIRTTTAPGMATFWPLDPLPKGKLRFVWSWSRGGQSSSLQGAFSAK